ncbi:MAG TPA: DUF2244 domain-containing protein [Solimonas sp.]|nr:DUF2244 domain-containing protein [Solimonas sp.]
MDTRLVIGPNASLSRRQAWGVMVLAAMSGLGIAIGFAVLGFWPILPFAGLELAALGAGLYVSVRGNAYREVLCFEQDRLRIEIGMLGQGIRSSICWSRSWTRVALERGARRHDPLRLLLRSAGQEVEIGRCLTDEEKARLKARLQTLLTPAWRTSPGVTGPRPELELPLGD